MNRRVIGLCSVLMLTPRWAAAAEPCEKIIVDASAECQLVADDEATLAKMPAEDQANAVGLKDEIAALKRRPFYPYCASLAHLNTKTCDTLASTISVTPIDLGEKKPL